MNAAEPPLSAKDLFLYSMPRIDSSRRGADEPMAFVEDCGMVSGSIAMLQPETVELKIVHGNCGCDTE